MRVSTRPTAADQHVDAVEVAVAVTARMQTEMPGLVARAGRGKLTAALSEAIAEILASTAGFAL